MLDGDPLADVRVLVRRGRIRLVLRDGIPIAGRDLDPPRIGGDAPPVDAELPQPAGPPSPCCLPAAASRPHGTLAGLV